MKTKRALERSAGGVIVEAGRALLIQMRNLEGAKVWTFPKGHLEAGETPKAAALREVTEETGFDCEITAPLYKARYSFVRSGCPVDKEVQWYLMKRVGGDGVVRTPEEIFGMRWCPFEEALKHLVYASDLKIIALLKKAVRRA